MFEVNDRTEKEGNPLRQAIIKGFLTETTETENDSNDAHSLEYIINIYREE